MRICAYAGSMKASHVYTQLCIGKVAYAQVQMQKSVANAKFDEISQDDNLMEGM